MRSCSERLRLEGDVRPSGNGQDLEAFDEGLEQAVRRFQQRPRVPPDHAFVLRTHPLV